MRSLEALLGREASADEHEFLRALSPSMVRVAAGTFVAGTGQDWALLFIDEGWLIRSAEGPGGRQLLDILLPGDVIGLESLVTGGPAAAVQAITAATLMRLPRAAGKAVVSPGSPVLVGVLHRLAEQARRADSLLTSLGRRSAVERMAFLFLDIHHRLADRGMARADWCPFPLRRSHLADLLGLSPTHVSRTMAELTGGRLANLSGGHLSILDRPGLERLAGYDPRTGASPRA